MAKTKLRNQDIADMLERIADLLEAQERNPFRVRSYRNAARTVRRAEESVAEMARRDPKALEDLPNIGAGLAGLIAEYVESGRSELLDRLEGKESSPPAFAEIPGIGPELAQRIVAELGVYTLPELEQAAHDGRLSTVPGFGPERVENVKVSLAGMISRSAKRRARQRTGEEMLPEGEPSVGLLLELDEEYRRKADKGELKMIAPKRFNPKGEAWLPILTTKRDDWAFTVLFSNTARAHELDKTHDWVVIYYRRGGREGQNTVVTATKGPLKGRRIVRGREHETRQYYGAEAIA